MKSESVHSGTKIINIEFFFRINSDPSPEGVSERKKNLQESIDPASYSLRCPWYCTRKPLSWNENVSFPLQHIFAVYFSSSNDVPFWEQFASQREIEHISFSTTINSFTLNQSFALPFSLSLSLSLSFSHTFTHIIK